MQTNSRTSHDEEEAKDASEVREGVCAGVKQDELYSNKNLSEAIRERLFNSEAVEEGAEASQINSRCGGFFAVPHLTSAKSFVNSYVDAVGPALTCPKGLRHSSSHLMTTNRV